MPKLQVIKKTDKAICWVCKGKKCPVCHGTGKWNEDIYYMIYKDKKGNVSAIDGDTIK